MVNLLTGQKGSGKTQQMIEAANLKAKECDGNVIFIKNSHNDTDYPSIRNIDEYTGFLYGMISGNSDIQVIFIDGILKQSSVTLEDMARFVDRLDNISKRHGVDFYVSISASKEDLADVNPEKCNYLN